jgi:hypothetical protein
LDYEKLAKVLALAGSGSDGEAVAAVRRAQALLSAEGLSFTDLGRRLAEPPEAPASVWQRAAQTAADHLGAYLRDRADRREEAAALTRRIGELERTLRARERTIAELRGELARLAEAVERAMPAGPPPEAGRAPAPPRRRGPQFELALE